MNAISSLILMISAWQDPVASAGNDAAVSGGNTPQPPPASTIQMSAPESLEAPNGDQAVEEKPPAQAADKKKRDKNKVKWKAKGQLLMRSGWQEKQDAGGGQDATSRWGFSLARARIGTSAKWKNLRVVGSLELSDAIDPPKGISYMRSAYAEIKLAHGLRLRIGHFKRPFSQQMMMGRLELIFPERSPFAKRALGGGVSRPGWAQRGLGVMLRGDLGPAKHRFTWQLAATDSRYDQQLLDFHARLRYRYDKRLHIDIYGASKQGEQAQEKVHAYAGGMSVKWQAGGALAQVEGIFAQDWLLADKPWIGAGTWQLGYRHALNCDYALAVGYVGELADYDVVHTGDLQLRNLAGVSLLYGQHLALHLYGLRDKPINLQPNHAHNWKDRSAVFLTFALVL